MTAAARLAETTRVLERTPGALRALLDGVGEAWLTADEGAGTYTPLDVLGHLIHGEDTDWIPRARWILAHGEARPFEPFDREGFRARWGGRPVDELLDAFAARRRANLAALAGLGLTEADLARSGTHPEFGRVTMDQLLSTWAVHDLTHLAQVVRVLARRYDAAVGPWRAYLGVLSREAAGPPGGPAASRSAP